MESSSAQGLRPTAETTYDGDVFDRRATVEQKLNAVRMVTLDGHVQRRQPVACLRADRGAIIEEKSDDTLVSAARSTVQCCESILSTVTHDGLKMNTQNLISKHRQ